MRSCPRVRRSSRRIGHQVDRSFSTCSPATPATSSPSVFERFPALGQPSSSRIGSAAGGPPYPLVAKAIGRLPPPMLTSSQAPRRAAQDCLLPGRRFHSGVCSYPSDGWLCRRRRLESCLILLPRQGQPVEFNFASRASVRVDWDAKRFRLASAQAHHIPFRREGLTSDAGRIDFYSCRSRRGSHIKGAVLRWRCAPRSARDLPDGAVIEVAIQRAIYLLVGLRCRRTPRAHSTNCMRNAECAARFPAVQGGCNAGRRPCR